MRGLIEFFVERSVLVNGLCIVVCILGALSFSSMNRDLIPTIARPMVRISGALPGASAVDTEQLMTFPIEEAVQDLAELSRLDSTTKAGHFEIDAVFSYEREDINEAVETIRARIDQLTHRLPSEARSITVRQMKQDRVDFLDIAITPVDPNNSTHRRWVRSLSERLDRLDHVVSVNSSLPRLDLYIELDAQKIASAGLKLSDIERRVIEHLRFEPIGEVRVDFERISVELKKENQSVEALRQLPITRNRVGRGLNLGDIAQVRMRSEGPQRLRRLDGVPFVKLEIYKDNHSDILDMEAKIREEIARFNSIASDGIEASVLGSASALIEKPLSAVLKGGIFGLALVGLVLLIFLGPRIACMAVVGLPFVYFGTFVILDAMGVQIHLISVIGMLLVLGILVDDAILVAERFLELRELGRSPKEAAVEAATGLFRPVAGTIITNIVVFAPILLVKGDMSSVFYAIPVVVIATLMLSLFESFLILPNHLMHFAGRGGSAPKIGTWLKAKYERSLGWFLKGRYLCLLGFLACLFYSFYLVSGMKKSFNLSLGTRSVHVRALVNETASLDETLAAGEALEKQIRALAGDKLGYIIRTAGESVVPGGHRVHGRGELHFRVVVDENAQEKQALADALEKRLKKDLSAGPQLRDLQIYQRQNKAEEEENVVTIFVAGKDSLPFEKLHDDIRAQVAGLKGVERARVDPERFLKGWQFVPDPSQLAVYDMSQTNLSAQLRQYFAPKELMRIRMLGDEVNVYTTAQSPGQSELQLETLKDLQVVTKRGVAVPLSTLGRWQAKPQLKEIQHRDLLRKFEIDVSYDRKVHDAEAIKLRLSDALEPLRKAHPQFLISVRPPESTTRAKSWMTKVGVSCLLIVFLTLVVVLDSVGQSLLVMGAIPFGFAGVIFAFTAHGLPLSLMAMIGLIGLTGVVVNDSLVLVDTINKVDPSLPFVQRVRLGAASRFKAVLLTSLTTLGGIFPMAYGLSPDAGWTRPMVLALGWGLLFATLLTLLLLPCAMVAMHDARRLANWAFGLLRPRKQKTERG